MCVCAAFRLFFHVVQSPVFLFLLWKDERPSLPPPAASGCQALMRETAQCWLIKVTGFLSLPEQSL